MSELRSKRHCDNSRASRERAWHFPHDVFSLSFFGRAASIMSVRGPGRCQRQRWRRYGFQVGDDGINLRRLELELKARHARRAIHDDLTHGVVTPARGFLGQRRPKDLTGYLGLQVAHAARLCDQLLAELLLRVEGGWLGSG